MNEENKTAEEHATSDIEEKARGVFDKIVDMGNRKYQFNFAVHGWVIGIVALLLLILIFK